MKFGDTSNDGAVAFGKPLDGLKVLALEQMQALPFATQLLARLGADVVKVEDPERGDASRASQPKVADRGYDMGHTFLRYNLSKRSLAVDIRKEKGRNLILSLLPQFDVVCENLGPGRAAKFGVDYEPCIARNPRLIYLSISGFGQTGQSPYGKWPAYASVAEAMSGFYDHVRAPRTAPVVSPTTGLGDSVTGLFGMIGVLAALRHRDRIGAGQFIDMSMYDSMISINEVMINFWSLGLRKDANDELRNPVLLTAFRCKDGWMTVFVPREHQFARFANVIGHPELLTEPKLATRQGWYDHTETIIRPIVEQWSRTVGKLEAARLLAEAGVAAAPCNSTEDLLADPHVQQRNMIVEVPRPDGVQQPILVAGNPIKMSKLQEGPESWFPVIGEHTREILASMLSMSEAELEELAREKVVAAPKLKEEHQEERADGQQESVPSRVHRHHPEPARKLL
jgi:crotonobetainyl-CoA:carnitine CoA-transferase CaiB-like acyl-CoA transferase